MRVKIITCNLFAIFIFLGRDKQDSIEKVAVFYSVIREVQSGCDSILLETSKNDIYIHSITKTESRREGEIQHVVEVH
jgi:hypothetical protein